MTELKAYACMETYECTGAIIFAKSNIEARKAAANEFNDSELGGMSVKRAPWADKYGSRGKIPIADMIDQGWHFECWYSGLRIDSEIYDYGTDKWNPDTKECEGDTFLVGKTPVGFQEGPVFACQEYADLHWEEQRKRKEYEAEMLKMYRGMVLRRLPDAVLIDGQKYGQHEHIYSALASDGTTRVVEQVCIPFEFPGMKHNASLHVYRNNNKSDSIGPLLPHFMCANGDRELFEKWAKEQKKRVRKRIDGRQD